MKWPTTRRESSAMEGGARMPNPTERMRNVPTCTRLPVGSAMSVVRCAVRLGASRNFSAGNAVPIASRDPIPATPER